MRIGIAIAVFVACGGASAQTLTVYGIEIGAPIAVAECRKETFGSSVSYSLSRPAPCMKASPVTAGPGDFSNGGFMDFPPGQAPSHARGSMVGITATGGIVGVVVLNTSGYQAQDSVFTDLIAKFGKPSKSGTIPFQNRMGAKFDGIAATWDLGEFQVEFLGITTAIDTGLLLIGTKAGLVERQARIDAVLKKFGKPL